MKMQVHFLTLVVLASASAMVFGGVALQTATAQPGCSAIDWVDRSQWQAKPSNLTKMKTPVGHVFIHHTAMDHCDNLTSCSANMRKLQDFMNVTRKMGDIGYNFLVGGDGRVYVGRGWDKNGRHTTGYNDKAVSICLMGNFMEIEPHPKMYEAVKNWIRCGVEKGIIQKDYQLHGHRDQVCTLCPGDRVYKVIKTWPQFVAGPLKTYWCGRTG